MDDPLSLASLFGAFVAGVLSVLSPCVMPLMPAYLSLISGISVEDLKAGGEAISDRRRVLLGCAGFVLGFSVIFVALGASATAVGHVLATWRVSIFGVSIAAAQVAGLIIILMGLHLVGWLPIAWLYRDAHLGRTFRPKGFLGTFLVGAAFAFGWSPCVGPILGGILTVAGGRETVYEGMLLLGIYSAGLGLPFFAAGYSLDLFLRWFERIRAHFRKVEVVAGVLLIGVGLLVLTNRLTALNSYFSFMNRLVEAAESMLL